MARQDGIVTLNQAKSAGMTQSAIDRRVANGDWRRLHRGVFIRADREHSPAVDLRAAVYAAGDGAVAYGPSAAWWHRMIDRPPTRHWVTVPSARRIARARDVRLRVRDIPSDDVTVVRDLAVTRVPLTVLETAVSIRNGSEFMDRALQRHTLLSLLDAAQARNSRRSGSTRAAELLRVARSGGESEAERQMHVLLRAAGITGWRANYPCRGFAIDVAFTAARLGCRSRWLGMAP